MQPSNVLFIFSDEHDPRYMGCSRHPFVKTPNLDRVAGMISASVATEVTICE